MNQPDPSPSQRTFVPDELPSDATVSELVRGLVGPAGSAAEPVDSLIDRLAGGASAAALLDDWRGADAWPAGWWRQILEGEPDLGTLESAKHQAKRAFAAAADPRSGPGSTAAPLASPAHDTALLGYLLTLAVGRVHHGRWLTALPVDTVQDWCTAVGGVADPPVDRWLLQAAEMG